jgi:hypothetical protein
MAEFQAGKIIFPVCRAVFPKGIAMFPKEIASIPTGMVKMPEGIVRFPPGGSIRQSGQPWFWRGLPLPRLEMDAFLRDSVWMVEEEG